MKTAIALLFAALMVFSFCAIIQAGGGDEVQPFNSEEGYGFVKPILSPGGRDDITWQAITSAPVGIGRTSTGVIGNYVYFFGSGTGTSTGIAYHIPTNTWVNSTPPPLPHRNYCGVVANGSFYLFGRYDQVQLLAFGDLQKFTPSGGGPTGTWTNLTSYPLSACGFAGDWDGGNYVYLVGGSDYTGGTYRGRINLFYRYNLTTNQYEALPSYPDTTNYCGGKFFNGKLYVMGGTDNAGAYLDAVRAFNPVTNQWENMANLPQANGFLLFSTTMNSRYIFCVGGGGGYSTWPALNAVQVYDPLANTWSLETPLPVTYGLNTATYVQAGNYILRVGGYNGTTWFSVAYKGLNPPGSSLTIDLTPSTTPVIIPSTGGNFSYTVTIQNLTSSAVTFDAWSEVVLPNGAVYGPLINRRGLVAPGSATISRLLSQNVPSIAPPGTYTYVGKVRVMPDSTVTYDSFPFSKLVDDFGGGTVYTWDVYGWDEMSAPASLNVPEEAVLLSAFPNPFNPSTTIGFQLEEAAMVKLAVFDITGREAARLVEGWLSEGAHQAVFDCGDLVSGVYFARLEGESVNCVKKLLLVK